MLEGRAIVVGSVDQPDLFIIPPGRQARAAGGAEKTGSY